MWLFFPVYWGQPCLWPSQNIFLHLDLSQASSLQSPFSLISSLNTSLHLFLDLPFTPSPSTCSVSILFNQHQLISPLNMAKPPQPVLSHHFSNVINCQHAPHPYLTAIQHCRSYACCIDNSFLPSDSSLFL